jgi:hypothetical protein
LFYWRSEDLIYATAGHPAVDWRRLGQGDADEGAGAEIPPDRFIADDCGDASTFWCLPTAASCIVAARRT